MSTSLVEDSLDGVERPAPVPGRGAARLAPRPGTGGHAGTAAPVLRAMSAAGARIVDAMATREQFGVPEFNSALRIKHEVLNRAQWSCILLFEREAAGDGPAVTSATCLDRFHFLLGSSASDQDRLDGIWGVLSGQTAMGSQPLDWPFVLARWVVAPLLRDAPRATLTEWTRVFHHGGEDRPSSRRYAQMAVADDRGNERRLGAELWAELRRSQFIHPMRLSPLANLIVHETHEGRGLIATRQAVVGR